LRKFAAAALAIPVLAMLYVPILLRRSVVLRLVVGLGAVGLIGLGVLTFLSPRPAAAKAPTVSAPLDAASFAQTVDAAHRLHDPIRLGFSSPMNVASVAAALTVDPATPVSTSWDTAHKTLTISPRGMWQAGTFYTVKVAAAALDAAGQPLGQAARALFNTRAATVAHLALSGSIAGSASPSSAFTVTFDSAVPAPTPDALLAISPAVSGTLTDVSTTTSSTSITFQPDKPLTAGVAYTIALQPGVVDADGSAVLAPEPLQITTAVPPQVVRFRPLNGTTAVPLGQRLSVRFTQAMDPATTATAFQARIGTKVLAGKVAWAEGNTVLVFTPSTPLAKGSVVVMSVSGAALSATGIPLAATKTVSFHTTAPVAAATKVKSSKPRSGSGGSTAGAGSSLPAAVVKALNQLTACLAGINVALYDAIARGFGVRVCDLIGGCGTTRIPAYASTGFFSSDPDRQLDHMLAEAAAHPYAGAKIKIGRGIKDDVARVRRAREMLGPDKLLMVDINGAYTADVALECARAIEPFAIHWIEEPLPPGDFRGYAELRARSPIPLAAGEAHHTVRDFRALIDGRCVDIVQPSIPTVGGLTEARRIATLAHAQNLRVAPHVWGGAVGLATACHFIAALPATPHTDHPPHPLMLEYDMSDNALRTQLLKTPLRLEAGHVLLPEGPGLGIELDLDAVERYRVC